MEVDVEIEMALVEMEVMEEEGEGEGGGGVWAPMDHSSTCLLFLTVKSFLA